MICFSNQSVLTYHLFKPMNHQRQEEDINAQQEGSHRPLQWESAQNNEQQYEINEEHNSNTYANMEENEQYKESYRQQNYPEPALEKIQSGQSDKNSSSKKESQIIITEDEKEWILRQANMQRIGGTYDYFIGEMNKYKRHLQCRKNVLVSIFTYMETNKITKAKTLILLKQYFDDLAEVCEDFHKKSYKYEAPIREEPYNPIICMKVQLKQGYDILFSMRRNVGNEHNRISKMIKDNIVVKLEKEMNVYWGVMFQAQKRIRQKQEQFKQQQSQILKRIQKIGKVYEKGREGYEISQDVFVQMTKFVKEQRQLRALIYDWGRQVLGLRKALINADYNLMSSFEAILNEYKAFNASIFQLKKKKFNFQQQLKDQIFKKYNFGNMFTPLDNDYISSILSFKKRKTLNELTPKLYQQFLSDQYFGYVIGDFKEVLKGTIKKTFPLKNNQEELIRSVSENLVLYNKKTLQIKNKLVMANTKAVYQGHGRVLLTEQVKGIIFDSKNTQQVIFSNGDRAQELVMSMEAEFGLEEVPS